LETLSVVKSNWFCGIVPSAQRGRGLADGSLDVA
jgi:hypothetical protein